MQPIDIPDKVTSQPFTVATARDAGLSWKVLQGRRFVRVGRGAYARRDPEITEASLIMGTLLTLPPQTLVTGISGLRLLGVLVGSPEPLRFVSTHPRQVTRRGVRVTRVTCAPGTAWVGRRRRTLLGGRCSGSQSARPGHSRGWLLRANRAGAGRGLDRPRETWLRCSCLVLRLALPAPQCNPTVSGARRSGRVDLTYLKYRVLIEYEGDQHRGDSGSGTATSTATTTSRRRASTVIRNHRRPARTHGSLSVGSTKRSCAGGYQGPEPVFDQRWMALFEK